MMSDVSNFAHYSEDISLWEPVTKAAWGLHDFCPVVTNFRVQTVMQAKLDTLSQAMALGGHQEAPMGHGVPPHCAKHHCWI